VSSYYNENDPRAAAWLRELIRKGHIANGYVDERDIRDVTPEELGGYHQHHFFAGIGGWSLALRLAGWPDDKPVWTGSCPCQPFSSAGKRAGFADDRHLWPAWHWLIQQCQPAIVFGEQVAGKAGESWFDLVSNDLEASGYACGAVTFPACSVGAPHLRQRLYWVGVADSQHPRRDPRASACQEKEAPVRAERDLPCTPGIVDRVANASSARLERRISERKDPERETMHRHAGLDCATDSLANTDSQRLQGRQERNLGPIKPRQQAPSRADAVRHNPWTETDWIYCRDGKYRPVEPGLEPLANVVPDHMVRLRGYGNAIVPQQAAEFIAACKAS